MGDGVRHLFEYGTKGKRELRTIFTDQPHDLYVKAFDSFALARQNRKTALANLEDGIETLKITEAFVKSSGQERAVRI